MMLPRALWLLAAVLSCLLASWAALWTWGDLSGDGVLERLNARLSSPIQSETWPLEWQRLSRARQLDPLSAEYPYLQAEAAQLIGSEALSSAGFDADADAFVVDAYREALRRRPHWGMLWAQLAAMRLASTGDLALAWQDLERAKTFALHEPSVRFTELRLGFVRWSQLDERQRQEIVETVRFLLGKNSRSLIDLAVSLGWVEQLRPLLREARDIGYLERRLERAEIFSRGQ